MFIVENHLGDLELDKKETNGMRLYKLPNGDWVPSITSVTSFYNRDVFIKWRQRVGDEEANRITKRATTRGTDFHEAAQAYLENRELKWDDYLPATRFMFHHAKPYLDKIGTIHAIERTLYSEYLGLAGRVDCIAEYDGVLSIIDFKTSTKERSDSWNENYYIQGSAYAEMFEERTSIPVQQVVILVVTEDGTVQEFVKDKEEYLPLLEQAVADFTQKEQESAKTN